MAIQDTDLLVVHRPGTSDLYKLAVGDLPIPDDVDVDLGYTPAVDKGTVTNSAGDDAEIPLAGVNAGLMDPDQVMKLLGIEEGAQVNIPAVTVLDTPPANPSDGDLWYNTSDGHLYIYYNDGSTSQWVASNPGVLPDITNFVKLNDEGTEQAITGGGGLSIDGITNVDALQTTERTITAGSFDLSLGNHWTCGAITVPNPSNCVAATSGLIRITAGPVVWSDYFKFPGGSAPTITSFPAIIPFYVQSASVILLGNVSEGIS